MYHTHTHTHTYTHVCTHVHTHIHTCAYTHARAHTHTHTHLHMYTRFTGECLYITVQQQKVCVKEWMDRNVVMVMYTNCQPSLSGTVLQWQKDGTRLSIPCPEALINYNRHMGGVDRGDQIIWRVRSFICIIYILPPGCVHYQWLHSVQTPLTCSCPQEEQKILDCSWQGS